MNTTPGPWIVVPPKDTAVEDVYLHQVISVAPDHNEIVALVRNPADAAAIAALPMMLDALIMVYEKLNTSKGVIDLEELNEVISLAVEKIAAESGEI